MKFSKLNKSIKNHGRRALLLLLLHQKLGEYYVLYMILRFLNGLALLNPLSFLIDKNVALAHLLKLEVL